jgi:hypothetical protein
MVIFYPLYELDQLSYFPDFSRFFPSLPYSVAWTCYFCALFLAIAAFKRPDARPLQSEANMQPLVAHLRLQPKHILAILIELSPRITRIRGQSELLLVDEGSLELLLRDMVQQLK